MIIDNNFVGCDHELLNNSNVNVQNIGIIDSDSVRQSVVVRMMIDENFVGRDNESPNNSNVHVQNIGIINSDIVRQQSALPNKYNVHLKNQDVIVSDNVKKQDLLSSTYNSDLNDQNVMNKNTTVQNINIEKVNCENQSNQSKISHNDEPARNIKRDPYFEKVKLIENMFESETAAFIAELYSFSDIPRKRIETILSLFKKLLSGEAMRQVKSTILQRFIGLGEKAIVVEGTEKLLSSLSSSLEIFKSEHLTFKYFMKKKTYIPPKK